MNITVDIPHCMNAAGQLIRRTPGSELAAVPARVTGSRAAQHGRRYASKYPVRTIAPRRAAPRRAAASRDHARDIKLEEDVTTSSHNTVTGRHRGP